MTKLEHALALAAMGFHVFPCIPMDKRPLVEGWQDKATRNPEGIRALWAKEPNANIGIYTGKFGDNGQALLVVDVDVKNGKDGRKSLADLRASGHVPNKTRTQRTPSGGFHLIYWTSPSLIDTRMLKNWKQRRCR